MMVMGCGNYDEGTVMIANMCFMGDDAVGLGGD